MTASALLHKRKTLLLVILFVAFPAFTANIVDLREELRIIPNPYSSLDNNITTGITNNFTFEMELIPILCFIHGESSVEISFLHLLPYGFRAPPAWS
jgi:hypothetical protein